MTDPSLEPARVPDAVVVISDWSSGESEAAGTSSDKFPPPASKSGKSEAAGTSSDKFPPPAGKSGKRYYLFKPRHSELGDCIVAGSQRARELLGGSWFGKGKAPRGFPTLEEALNAFEKENGGRTATIYW